VLKKVKRIVCTACGAIWFVAPNDKCPSCKGSTKERDCTEDESGVVKVADA
jgi:rubrerythrin